MNPRMILRQNPETNTSGNFWGNAWRNCLRNPKKGGFLQKKTEEFWKDSLGKILEELEERIQGRNFVIFPGGIFGEIKKKELPIQLLISLKNNWNFLKESPVEFQKDYLVKFQKQNMEKIVEWTIGRVFKAARIPEVILQ